MEFNFFRFESERSERILRAQWGEWACAEQKHMNFTACCSPTQANVCFETNLLFLFTHSIRVEHSIRAEVLLTVFLISVRKENRVEKVFCIISDKIISKNLLDLKVVWIANLVNYNVKWKSLSKFHWLMEVKCENNWKFE